MFRNNPIPEEKQNKFRKNNLLDFKTLFKQSEPESSFVLIIVPVILTVWAYFGKQAGFDQLFRGFQGRWGQDFYSTIYEYMTAFLLMFWVPYFIIKFLLK